MNVRIFNNIYLFIKDDNKVYKTNTNIGGIVLDTRPFPFSNTYTDNKTKWIPGFLVQYTYVLLCFYLLRLMKIFNIKIIVNVSILKFESNIELVFLMT